MVASERRCVGVDRQCRESEGKAKIEGYMSVSDEEAHHCGKGGHAVQLDKAFDAITCKAPKKGPASSVILADVFMNPMADRSEERRVGKVKEKRK